MQIVDIGEFENTVVVHFETPDNRINAYTLASALVALADAAKAANATLNAGAEIEIVVEATGPGSFRALIRAIFTQGKGLFKNQVFFGLVIGVLGNYIYERTFALDNKVTVQVNTNEVVIQKGEERVVVPRNVYDATRQVEKNPEFVKAIGKTFDAVARDEKVESFGLIKALDSPKPQVPIPRSSLLTLASHLPEDPDTRTITEEADLEIVKALMIRSKRKWEFVWRGVTISAPVSDNQFFERFSAHEVRIAPGDILRGTLAIRQMRDPTNGIYTNVGYEVVQVNEHVPRVRQAPLPPS